MPGLAGFKSAALMRTTSLKGPAARYKSPWASNAIPPGDASTFLPSTVRDSTLPTTTGFGDFGSTRKTLPVTRSEVYKTPVRSAVMFSMMTVRSVLAGSRSTSMDTTGLPICDEAQPLKTRANRLVVKSLMVYFLIKMTQIVSKNIKTIPMKSLSSYVRQVKTYASDGQKRLTPPWRRRLPQ